MVRSCTTSDDVHKDYVSTLPTSRMNRPPHLDHHAHARFELQRVIKTSYYEKGRNYNDNGNIVYMYKWQFHKYSQICRVCVLCVCFLPIYCGCQVRWMYQPGSHRRKVTRDFSSPFLLRCMPLFFSREGFSHSFPSSSVKSNFVN